MDATNVIVYSIYRAAFVNDKFLSLHRHNQPIYNFSIFCAGIRKGPVCMQKRDQFFFKMDGLMKKSI
jgi:hypothetical protein